MHSSNLGRLKKLYYTKLVINNKSSKELAYAQNQVTNATSHKYLAFTDDNVIIDRFWIKMIIYRLFSGNLQFDGIVRRFLPLNNDILCQYYTEQKILEPSKKLQYLITVNCSYKKQGLEEIGLFNESFHIASGEDTTEHSLRLKKDKYQFV
ncbi:MAG: hypothetical protein ACTSVV_05445 [Promethearchaeota archaeon]